MMRAMAVGILLAAALAGQPVPPVQPAEVVYLPTPAPPNTFLFSKPGTLVGAICDDDKLRLWSLPERKPLREFDLSGRVITEAAMSDDGTWIAVADSAGVINVWNSASGAEKMHLKVDYYAGSMNFSPDGRRLAIAAVRQPVSIYDTASGNKLFELPAVMGGTKAVVFSRDNELIATADLDTSVRVFDGRSGSMLDHNETFLLEAFAVAFTPDRKQLFAAGADKVVLTIDVATGDVIHKSEKTADPVTYLEVSPDGKLVVAAMMHAVDISQPAPVAVLDAVTGKQVQEWKPPTIPLGGGWTADGHLIAATATKEALRIWRVR